MFFKGENMFFKNMEFRTHCWLCASFYSPLLLGNLTKQQCFLVSRAYRSNRLYIYKIPTVIAETLRV